MNLYYKTAKNALVGEITSLQRPTAKSQSTTNDELAINNEQQQHRHRQAFEDRADSIPVNQVNPGTHVTDRLFAIF